MGDFINTTLLIVEVQENGIIRDNKNGRIIGRLIDEVKFQDLTENKKALLQNIIEQKNKFLKQLQENESDLHALGYATALDWAEEEIRALLHMQDFKTKSIDLNYLKE